MIALDAESILAMLAKEAEKEGPAFLARQAEYMLCAYGECRCVEHSCGGCANTLHLALELDKLLATRGMLAEDEARERGRARWKWTQERRRERERHERIERHSPPSRPPEPPPISANDDREQYAREEAQS